MTQEWQHERAANWEPLSENFSLGPIFQLATCPLGRHERVLRETFALTLNERPCERQSFAFLCKENPNEATHRRMATETGGIKGKVPQAIARGRIRGQI